MYMVSGVWNSIFISFILTDTLIREPMVSTLTFVLASFPN